MNRRQEANRLYNSFKIKDMPRHKFVEEFLELTDSDSIQRDLANILHNKRKIDRRLN